MAEYLHNDDPFDPLADKHQNGFEADTDAPLKTVIMSRHTLLKRLADMVCLPESRVNAFERAVTADLLAEMLSEASLEERQKVARRLSRLAELPHSLLRMLIIDVPEIAKYLIEDCESLSDSDINFAIRRGGPEHRFMLAARKAISPILAEILIETGDVEAIGVLLRNKKAALSQQAMETVVAMSQKLPSLIDLIIKRPELRPSSAYVLFWWSDAQTRRHILSRFSVNREIMQDATSDVFAMAAAEGWNDPLSRKALQFIERRQRNRAALEKSPYSSLEHALEDVALKGLTRFAAEEISYLAGIKPSTGAKIMRDSGGEGLAVLCKSTGLKKASLVDFWKALRRPMNDSEGNMHPDLERVLLIYELLATDKAQTVLRYWNWALSSALSSVVLKSITDGKALELEGLSIPERSAVLAFAQDFQH